MFLCQHMCIRGFEGFMFLYNKSMYIMPTILCTSTCALRGVVGRKWQVGTVGQVLMDCCICISFAKS